MKKCILAFALVFAFSLATFAQGTYGSNSSQSQPSAQPSATPQADTSSAQSDTAKTSKSRASSSSGKEHGVTGCLEQGSAPGTYVIKNAKHPDGVEVSYSGSEDLSKHVGHKVKASGSMSGRSLNATDVKHISETCSVGGGDAASSGGHKHHHEAGSKGTSSSSSSTETGSGTSATTPK